MLSKAINHTKILTSDSVDHLISGRFFRLERIDLGDSIPRIINLRVCPSTCTQEIVLDIQFNYTGWRTFVSGVFTWLAMLPLNSSSDQSCGR